MKEHCSKHEGPSSNLPDKLNPIDNLRPTLQLALALSARAEWNSRLHTHAPCHPSASAFNVNLNSRHRDRLVEFSHSSSFTPPARTTRAHVRAGNNFLWCKKAFNYAARPGRARIWSKRGSTIPQETFPLSRSVFSARNHACQRSGWLYARSRYLEYISLERGIRLRARTRVMLITLSR